MGHRPLSSPLSEAKLAVGQQRFTTITILILAALKCIRSYADQNKEDLLRVEEQTNRYIGKLDPVTLRYDNILVLSRNNDSYFRDYIVKMDTSKVRNLKATEKLMYNCFLFFEQHLKGKYSSGKEYAEFIQTVVANLYFTQIIVSDEMNAFRVFETLNARGVQLSSADLLKNYLFSLVDKENPQANRIDMMDAGSEMMQHPIAHFK